MQASMKSLDAKQNDATVFHEQLSCMEDFEE